MTDTHNPRNARTGEGSAESTIRSRRSRRLSASPSAASVERRRLFSASSERAKSKSASRTRALKAKPAQSNPQGPSPVQIRSFRRPSGSMSEGTRAKTGTSAKPRPVLPSTSAPGRVPPARGLVRRRRRTLKTPAPVRYVIQLAIVGLGVAAIGGTLLKVLPKAPAQETATVAPAAAPAEPTKTFPVELTREIAPVKAELQSLPNLYPSLVPKIFYADVDTGEYISVDGGEAIAAASTIKLPILLAFFEEVDAGRIDINRTMSIQPQQIASGSGDMQVAEPNTQYTALEVATQMIVNSDNTATNMMIDLLGGQEALNDRFVGYGLETTQLNAPLPDLEGTNLTSARDLSHTMLLISQGQALSTRSRDRVLNILKRTFSKGLIPANLEEKGALTYNKTGDIGSVLGDVALIDLPNGKRYVVAVLVERPNNDGRARELIRRVSSRTYQIAESAVQSVVIPAAEPATDETSSTTDESN
ncbi:MAG: serine hydrolase [Cyanobacteria bacterium P01_D01_bin.1]